MKPVAPFRRTLPRFSGLLGLGLLLLASGPGSARPARPQEPAAPTTGLTPLARHAYGELLRLRPAAARALPATSAGNLLVLDCADFLELMLSQDITRYEAVIEAQDDHLAALAQLPTGPLPAYAAAEIRLHRATAQIAFGHELQGAWSLRQGYQQLQAVAARYPAYLPARKTLGLCQFFIGALPPGYRWFLKLLGMPGNTAAGLRNLRAAADQPNDFQPEAQLLLALLEESYYHRDSAAATVARLAARQPDNLLFNYLAVSLYKRQHQTERALALYHARPTGPAYLPMPYLHHLAADLLLYQGQYAASQEANQLFLRHYHGQHYRKDAAFKLYLAAWLGGDAAAAARYRRQIAQAGRTDLEEDAAAQRFVNDQLPLDPVLTRARLQIDGGYYREALRTLRGFAATPATPLRDQLETPYRRARAYHGLEQLDSARHYYRQTIARAGAAPYYFAPQAALQLGYLYQAAGQPQLARTYFQKALDSPKHEYKNSTDAKAKVALAALK